MAEETENTKSPFLFVKPGSSNIGQFKCYCGDKPVHAFELSGWEWLLERMVRRIAILENFRNGTSGRDSLKNLTSSFRIIRNAGWGKTMYHKYPFERLTGENHDGEMYTAGLQSWLPEFGYSKEFMLRNTVDLYHYLTLEFAPTPSGGSPIEFIDPNWVPDQNGFRTEASLSVSTEGDCTYSLVDTSAAPSNWIKTKISNRSPFTLPQRSFFPILNDVRIDDELVANAIRYKGINIDVYTVKTAFGLEPSDALATWGSEQIRYADGHFVSKTMLNYRETLAFLANPATVLDDSDKLGNIAYPKESDVVKTVKIIYGKPSGNPIAAYLQRSQCYFCPNISWGNGEPSWWRANGFPKGLNSIESAPLRAQISALCQTPPILPPTIVGLRNNGQITSNAKLVNPYYNYTSYFLRARHGEGGDNIMDRANQLAVTPFNIAKGLDALTKTIHRVTGFFTEVSAEEYISRSYTDTPSDHEETTCNRTVNGTVLFNSSLHGIDAGITTGNLRSSMEINVRNESEDHNQVCNEYHNEDQDLCSYSYYKNIFTTEFISRAKITLKHVRPLNVTSGITTNRKISDDLFEVNTFGKAYTKSVSNGQTPSSLDVSDDKLLVPLWLRPWIKSVEIFYAYTINKISSLPYESEESNRSEKSYNSEDGWVTTESTRNEKVNGEGEVRAVKGIISLGKLNLETGELPDIDLIPLLNSLLPDKFQNKITKTAKPYFRYGSFVSGFTGYQFNTSDGSSIETRHTYYTRDSSGSYDRTTKEYHTGADKVNSYDIEWGPEEFFAVIEWDFDNEAPVGFGEGGDNPYLNALYRLQAAKNNADSARKLLEELSSQEQPLRDYISELETKLQEIDAKLDDPEGLDSYESDALGQAQHAVDVAQEKFDLASSEADAARAELDQLRSNQTSLGSSLLRMKDELETLESQGPADDSPQAIAEYDTIIQELRANISSTETALEETNSQLIESTRSYTAKLQAKLEAEAELEAATEYYNTLAADYESYLQNLKTETQEKLDQATAKLETLVTSIQQVSEQVTNYNSELAEARADYDAAVAARNGSIPSSNS